MRHVRLLLLTIWGGFTCFTSEAGKVNTPVVDTGQTVTYNARRAVAYPQSGEPFFGQDAQYAGNQPSYRDNGDGTVTDQVTGLMWSQTVNSDKMTLTEALVMAKNSSLGGYTDWRIPNIKELYSLIDFRGYTGFGRSRSSIPSNAIPYINTDYFDFMYGDVRNGERYIDAQWLSNTRYVSTTMDHMETLFGVNFADGRIKGYGYKRVGAQEDRKRFYVRLVRGNTYGDNDFQDNGDGTITDRNTTLMWTKADSGAGMTWENALAYAENSTDGDYSDWRLPNAKELQSLVDYTRSPDTTDSPAIAPVFQTSVIQNESGQKDYPYFWTSTTHLDGPTAAAGAVYIAFGRAIGQMRGRIMDVHGAGAQRSDPKSGQARIGHGPQGDALRVFNYVRLVRGGVAQRVTESQKSDSNRYPEKIRVLTPSPTKPVRLGAEAIKQENMRGRPMPRDNMEPDGRGRGGFVSRLDKNHDGKVSRSEFDGPGDHFDILDRNHDGYLSEDEAPPKPPRR